MYARARTFIVYIHLLNIKATSLQSHKKLYS